MSRWARKVDVNHGQIRDAFRQMGYWVEDMSRVGGDFPDLLIARKSVTGLVEVKADKGKLTEGQKSFLLAYPGLSFVCRTLDDVSKVDQVMRDEANARLHRYKDRGIS